MNTSNQAHSITHYIQVWATVLALFIVSVVIAQVSHNRPLVLIVAFSISTIQALLVAAYFMHLKEEQTYISYLLASMLLALVMLYAGTMADLSHPKGVNWIATDTTRIIQEHAVPSAGNIAHLTNVGSGEHK